MFCGPKYLTNECFLKLYGCGAKKKIKVVAMSSVRNFGIEDDSPKSAKGTVNTEKTDSNLRRAKSKIFELAFCNPWEWFFTATLDPSKYDRTNLERFHHDLTAWICDFNHNHGVHIRFLLIPELHSDGKSWHMHGFLMGLPASCVRRFCIGDRMGKKLADKVQAGDSVYNWPAYAAKFGYCDLEPVHNPEACAKYVTKYVTKELDSSVKELGAHLYYRSRGLAGAKTIARGLMQTDILHEPSYCGDYASVWWLEYSEELLQALWDSFSVTP